MDIKIPHSLLLKYLDTPASPAKIAKYLTLCGPSVDRLKKFKGDYVYETEIITNRVDSASALGLAREANAILPQFGIQAKIINDPYKNLKPIFPKSKKNLPLKVQILDQSLVSRFSTIVVDNLSVKSSPISMKKQLELSGQHSVNNLVDITNFLTLSLGQPVHIFDYDKIGQATLKLRGSKKGETITTLNHVTHTLRGDDIIIEDGDGKLIDLCGCMGGLNSEIDENTKRAVLFVQTYEPKHIRKTSLYTQTRSIAAQIFEKAPDPNLVLPTLFYGFSLLQELAGANIASPVIDIYPKPIKTKKISVDLNWISHSIGINIPTQTIVSILELLGFKTLTTDTKLSCTVPTWRVNDVNIKEDILEEVSRIYGYFKLPDVLPPTAISLRPENSLLKWEYETKVFLSNLGFTEIYTFSLISKSLFDKSSLSINHSLELQNPLNSDFQFLRRSLIPSSLQTLADNRGKFKLPIRIFELSNIYLKTDSKLPIEAPILTLSTEGLDFFQTKGYVEALLRHLKIPKVTFTKLDEDSDTFDKYISANVYSGSTYLGLIGKISRPVTSNFQLSQDVYIANLNFLTLSDLASDSIHITPLPLFPEIREVVTITSDKSVGELIHLIKERCNLISHLAYKTSFKNKHTFDISFNHPKRNLTQKEVNELKEIILSIN